MNLTVRIPVETEEEALVVFLHISETYPQARSILTEDEPIQIAGHSAFLQTV